MTSRIVLRPATEADATTMATIGNDAFGFDAIAQAFFPASREPDLTKRLDDDFQWRCGRAKGGLAHPRRHYIMAEEAREDGDKDVVGWACWELLLPVDGVKEMSKEEEEKMFEERAKQWPSSLDVDAVKAFGEIIEAETEKIMGKDGTNGMWSKFSCFLP